MKVNSRGAEPPLYLSSSSPLGGPHLPPMWPSHWGSTEACWVPLSLISSAPETWHTKLNSEPLISHAQETVFCSWEQGYQCHCMETYCTHRENGGDAVAAVKHSFSFLCFDTHCKHSLQETIAITDKLCEKNKQTASHLYWNATPCLRWNDSYTHAWVCMFTLIFTQACRFTMDLISCSPELVHSVRLLQPPEALTIKTSKLHYVLSHAWLKPDLCPANLWSDSSSA